MWCTLSATDDDVAGEMLEIEMGWVESVGGQVYTNNCVGGENLETETGWVETLGGDLSQFQLTTGAYYLCRRDFFTLMEVGRLPADWLSILVGERVEATEVRGWRMTGRPRQSYQSFTVLERVGCIIDGSGLKTQEEIHNIVEAFESSSGKEIMPVKSTI